MVDYINEKFNKLTILKDAGRDKYSHKLVEVQCDCEKQTIFITRLRSILDNISTSCGCVRDKKLYETFKKYNTYNLTGEYGIGYTNKTNKEFYFDLEDYDLIKDISWCVTKKGYIKGIKEGNTVGMHNVVMDNLYIDHINLNPSDNRKENLRLVTPLQNTFNRKGTGVLSKFGLKGIDIEKKSMSYHGIVQHDRKAIYSKYYKDITLLVQDKVEFEKSWFGEHRYAWENDILWKELLEYEKNFIDKSNIIRRKFIYCGVNKKTYKTQAQCAEDLNTYKEKISSILLGKTKNIYELKYVDKRNYFNKKYKIISGILTDREFNGHEQMINGELRIWDCDSFGRSYPIENCEEI